MEYIHPENLTSIFWLVIVVLACWRITSILYAEKIGKPLRKLIGIIETPEGEEIYPDHFLGQLFSCFWCLSVWIALFCLFAVIFVPFMLLPFAISAAAIAIDRHI